jgi:hypothetical protein
MFGNITIAFFAGLGAAIWVYRKFARRASGGDFVKTITPAIISGVIIFFVALTILWTIF